MLPCGALAHPSYSEGSPMMERCFGMSWKEGKEGKERKKYFLKKYFFLKAVVWSIKAVVWSIKAGVRARG